MSLVNKLDKFISKYNTFVRILLYILFFWLYPILFIIDYINSLRSNEITEFIILIDDIINKNDRNDIKIHLNKISKYVKKGDKESIKTEMEELKTIVDDKYIKYLDISQVKIINYINKNN